MDVPFLRRYVAYEKPGKNPAPAGYKRKPLKHFNRKAALTQRTDRKRTKIDIKENKRKEARPRTKTEGREEGAQAVLPSPFDTCPRFPR